MKYWIIKTITQERYLTCIEPCFAIYSCNKSQQDALFLNFILVNNYVFRTDLLPIIRSLNTVFTQQFHLNLVSSISMYFTILSFTVYYTELYLQYVSHFTATYIRVFMSSIYIYILFYYLWAVHICVCVCVRVQDHRGQVSVRLDFLNPLKPELNPICYLLALLGAHHFLHVSRIRVKLLTFRLLMS